MNLINENFHSFNLREKEGELIQKIVGRIQPQIPAEAFLVTRISYKIADAFSFIGDLFARIWSSKEGVAQREMRQDLKNLVVLVNEGGVYQDSLKAVINVFSTRIKALDSSLTNHQVALLFNKTMTALSEARRNSIDVLILEKVELLTKEINLELGIKESEGEPFVLTCSSYKKVAIAVAGLALLATAAYYGMSFLKPETLLDIQKNSLANNKPAIPSGSQVVNSESFKDGSRSGFNNPFTLCRSQPFLPPVGKNLIKKALLSNFKNASLPGRSELSFWPVGKDLIKGDLGESSYSIDEKLLQPFPLENLTQWGLMKALSVFSLAYSMRALLSYNWKKGNTELTEQQRHLKTLTLEETNVRAWIDLGMTIEKETPLTVKDSAFISKFKLNELTKQQCYLKALTLDKRHAFAWFILGNTIKNGTPLALKDSAFISASEFNGLTKQKCYIKSLAIDKINAPAWSNLGLSIEEGATLIVDDAEFRSVTGLDQLTEPKCYIKALTLDSKNAALWTNLAATIVKGDTLIVDDTEFRSVTGLGQLTEQKCYLKVLTFDPKNALAWFNLGTSLLSQTSWEGADPAFTLVTKLDQPTAQQCYLKSLAFDSENATAWSGLGFAIGIGTTMTVNDPEFTLVTGLKQLTAEQCFKKAEEIRKK